MKTCQLHCWLAIFMVSSAYVYSSEQTTNVVALDYRFDIRTIDLDRTNTDWQKIFSERVTARGPVEIINDFGPPSFSKWLFVDEHSRIDKLNSQGVQLIRDILLDSARETAVSVLPIDQWEEFGRGTFGNFLIGSIGNTAEENLDITDSSVSLLTRPWIERVHEINYGIRPFRTDPYIYLSAPIGHFDDSPMVIADIRFYYDILDTEKIETNLVFPMPFSSRMDIGISLSPTKIVRHDNDRLTTVFRLGKYLNHLSGNIFAGFKYNEEEIIATVGFFKSI